MQNVADCLIVKKIIQLYLTFIICDFVNTMGCKTLLTLWLLRWQCSYGWCLSHWIVFTQWDAKRCWLSDCAEYNVGMLDVHFAGLCSHNGMKTLLTLWLLKWQCSYVGRLLHWIVFTQWDAKRCWLSDCYEDNVAMLDVLHTWFC